MVFQGLLSFLKCRCFAEGTDRGKGALLGHGGKTLSDYIKDIEAGEEGVCCLLSANDGLEDTSCSCSELRMLVDAEEGYQRFQGALVKLCIR